MRSKSRTSKLPVFYYRRKEVDEILKSPDLTDDAIAAGLLTPVRRSRKFVIFDPHDVTAVARDALAGKFPPTSTRRKQAV